MEEETGGLLRPMAPQCDGMIRDSVTAGDAVSGRTFHYPEFVWILYENAVTECHLSRPGHASPVRCFTLETAFHN
jgi:hypothetical protein